MHEVRDGWLELGNHSKKRIAALLLTDFEPTHLSEHLVVSRHLALALEHLDGHLRAKDRFTVLETEDRMRRCPRSVTS